jgi:hypothetical protein
MRWFWMPPEMFLVPTNRPPYRAYLRFGVVDLAELLIYLVPGARTDQRPRPNSPCPWALSRSPKRPFAEDSVRGIFRRLRTSLVFVAAIASFGFLIWLMWWLCTPRSPPYQLFE